MVNAGRVDRQLTPVLGEEKAHLITSLSVGFDRLINENPIAQSFLTPTIMLAIAAQYGVARRLCIEAIERTEEDGEMRASAQNTLTTMEKIVEATNAVDPDPPQSDNPILEMLRRAGVPVEGAVVLGDSTGGPTTAADVEVDAAVAEPVGK